MQRRGSVCHLIQFSRKCALIVLPPIQKTARSVIWLYSQGGGAASSFALSAESADSQGRGTVLPAVQLLLVTRGEHAVGSEAVL